MYRLRELEEKDMFIVNRWRNNVELISMLAAPYRFINLSVDKNWFNNYMNNRSNEVRCAIVAENNDDILGLVSLTSINQLNQSAEFHIMIGENVNQGKGMGTFAVNEMLNHAFNNLNLHRIELTVLKSNQRAQKLYEKSGFKKEGTLRGVYYKNGTYVDAYLYAILKEDYQALNSCNGVIFSDSK